MKILISGHTGQVARELQLALHKHELVSLGRQAFDLSHPDSLRETILRERPALVINAAAYTAVDNGVPINDSLISEFENHKVHQAVEECCKLRPPVDISLFAETSTKEIVIE